MAENSDEYTRLIMSNIALKNSLGLTDTSALKDWQAQVNAMTKALNSATNSLVKVTNQVDAYGKAITSFDVPKNKSSISEAVFNQKLMDFETKYNYLAGSLTEDPYKQISKTMDYKNLTFNQDFKGTKSKQVLKEIMQDLGGSVETSPTRKHKDRMQITFPVSESTWNDTVNSFDGNESKARADLVRKFKKENLGSAIKYSNVENSIQKDKENTKEQEKHNKENSGTFKQGLSALLKVFTVVTVIANIARRILTSLLSRATEVTSMNSEGVKNGVSITAQRQFKATERVMGLPDDTMNKALSSLASNFGETKNLNTRALESLAQVMGGGIETAIRQGLGESNPYGLLEQIVNAYYQRGLNGVNSLGIRTDRASAQRELATSLENAGLGEIATILRSMNFQNSNGIYKDRVSDLESYLKLYTPNTMGNTPSDYQYFSALGQTARELQQTFNDLKNNLELGLLSALARIISKINSWDIGKSQMEKLDSLQEKREFATQKIAQLNEQANISNAITQGNFTEFLKDNGLLQQMSIAFGATDFFKIMSSLASQNGIVKQNQQSAFGSLQKFAQTEKGKQALAHYFLATDSRYRASDLQEILDDSYKSGNLKFDPLAYSLETQLQNIKEDTKTWLNNNNSSESVMRNAPQRAKPFGLLITKSNFNDFSDLWGFVSANQVDKNNALEMYGEYIVKNGDWYQSALNTGRTKNLNKALFDVAKNRRPNDISLDAKAFNKKNLDEQNEYVQGLLEIGYLSQDDVKNEMGKYIGTNIQRKGGLDEFNWADLMTEVNILQAQNNINSTALALQAVKNASKDVQQKLLGAQKVTSSVYKESDFNNNVTVNLIVKDAQGRQQTYSYTVDGTNNPISAEKTFNVDLSTELRKNILNGSK